MLSLVKILILIGINWHIQEAIEEMFFDVTVIWNICNSVTSQFDAILLVAEIVLGCKGFGILVLKGETKFGHQCNQFSHKQA